MSSSATAKLPRLTEKQLVSFAMPHLDALLGACGHSSHKMYVNQPGFISIIRLLGLTWVPCSKQHDESWQNRHFMLEGENHTSRSLPRPKGFGWLRGHTGNSSVNIRSRRNTSIFSIVYRSQPFGPATWKEAFHRSF